MKHPCPCHVPAVYQLLPGAIDTTADAALIGRLPTTPGGTDYQACYYGDRQDGIWHADTDGNSLGARASQSNWVTGFEVYGVSGWRQPDADVNGDGPGPCVDLTIFATRAYGAPQQS